MPTPLHLKPPFAAWLVRERNARGWKPRDVVNALAAQRITVTEGTVKVWEANSNRTPAPTTIEALERVFEKSAPTSSAPTAGQDALISALTRQSLAIEELVQELRLGRAAQVEAAEVTLRALGSLGARPDLGGMLVGSEREARAGTGR